jgi:membrane protein DedA with SNARE-associated domain
MIDLMALLLEYKYVVMAPAAAILGPSVSLVAGVLLRLEVLALAPTVLALAIGELSADIVWYWLGKKYGESFVHKYGKFVHVSKASIERAKALFSRHSDVIIFTTKLTAGLGFGIPVMFTAGLTGVPFKRYMMLNIAGQFVWTTGLLSIGYFLGHIYVDIGNVFEKMALVALLIVIVLSLFGFAKYLRSVIS